MPVEVLTNRVRGCNMKQVFLTFVPGGTFYKTEHYLIPSAFCAHQLIFNKTCQKTNKKNLKMLNIQRENPKNVQESMFSGRKFSHGDRAGVFLLQQFNHIFHVIGKVLKEGWREEKSQGQRRDACFAV